MRLKILVSVFSLLLLSAAPAFAQHGGGFVKDASAETKKEMAAKHDKANKVITVEEAKKMSPKELVTLEGIIEKNVHGKIYEFKDSSGSIKVEIEHDKWHGAHVMPNEKVKIYGKIAKEKDEIIIDVKSVVKEK